MRLDPIAIAINGQVSFPIYARDPQPQLANKCFPVVVWLVVPPPFMRCYVRRRMKVFPPNVLRELWACAEPRWCDECNREGGVGPAHDPSPCPKCEGAGYLF